MRIGVIKLKTRAPFVFLLTTFKGRVQHTYTCKTQNNINNKGEKGGTRHAALPPWAAKEPRERRGK